MKFLLVQSRRCPSIVGWYRKVESVEELNLLPKRSAAMLRALFTHGHVLLNRVGGWCFLTEDSIVLDEQESEGFPTPPSDKLGRIYISRWPLGNHWYLSSWPKPLVFSSEKFNTYAEAFAEARKFVPEDRIDPHVHFIYQKEGD